jgi:beta-fructofuranosidase
VGADALGACAQQGSGALGASAGGAGAGGPEDKDGCFSGSAVVDGDTLALIYTGHKFHGDPSDEANLYQVQCLATSRDGIHFERQGWWSTPRRACTISATRRCGGRGQLVHDRRRARRRYRPGAAVSFSRSAPVAGRGVLDEAESTMGYMWECPDFFTLNGKRVLMFSPQGMQAEGFRNRNLFQSGYLIGEWQPGQRLRHGEFGRWITATISMPRKASPPPMAGGS